MALTLTKYIYPLEKPIEFFKDPYYEFDNARTKEEVQLVKEFISKTLQFENKKYEKENAEQSMRTLFGIGALKDYLKENNPDDYSLKYYEANLEKPLIDILAETWIIVRFKDEGDFDKIVADRDELIPLILTKADTSFTNSFKTLSGICHLISLLANSDSDYHGESFLLSKNAYEIFYSLQRHEVDEVIEQFKSVNFMLKIEHRLKHWTNWLDGNDEIINSGKNIFSLYTQPAIRPANTKVRASQKQTPAQKLLHVGNHLKMSYGHLSDPELMLLLLVGSLEFLVTRNPDTSKFNVEDSITKQFKLKCSTLIHSLDKSNRIDEISKNLEKIYDKRSDIAHGNYIDDYNPKETVDLVIILYQYLRVVISAYIADRELVDYLKDN